MWWFVKAVELVWESISANDGQFPDMATLQLVISLNQSILWVVGDY